MILSSSCHHRRGGRLEGIPLVNFSSFHSLDYAGSSNYSNENTKPDEGRIKHCKFHKKKSMVSKKKLILPLEG